MSDTIFLDGLEVQTILGIQDWERETKQTVRIDLELPADARSAADEPDEKDTDSGKGQPAQAKRARVDQHGSGRRLLHPVREQRP